VPVEWAARLGAASPCLWLGPVGVGSPSTSVAVAEVSTGTLQFEYEGL
jgi:hypothetical protein